MTFVRRHIAKFTEELRQKARTGFGQFQRREEK